MQAYCKDLQVLDINGQFGKLTDRKEIPVPELAEGGQLFHPGFGGLSHREWNKPGHYSGP